MGIENNWFMMVTTNNTDPRREEEFNAWYNDIDIPDVLEVPGYMRARRGQAQGVPGFPESDFQQDEAQYVALYDIDSEDMDKTIIAMLMASWKMEKVDRSTDLLEVFERVYYRQFTPALESSRASNAGKNTYLYLVRLNATEDEGLRKQFNDWYDGTYLPAMIASDGVVRATRYQLYWVLMIEPPEIPDYLTVFEIQADSADQALEALSMTSGALRDHGKMHPAYDQAGATIYRQIREVRRNQ